MEFDVRSIARRAAQRALAEPDGLPLGRSVIVSNAGARPLQVRSQATSAPARSRPWITQACLDAASDGEVLYLAQDTRITALAQEIADQRNIQIRRGTPVSAGFGTDHPPILAIGSDHGGFALKEHLIVTLKEWGYRPLDMGTRDARASDYPDSAQAVAECVADGRAVLGICIDGAGIGSAMTAGKVPGVLPANCWDERTAANAREHNHANVLCLGAGHLGAQAAEAVVRTFLTTAAGPERHARRVDKIWAVEARYLRQQEGLNQV